MVRLNRIYTKTGDDGTTGLGSGERVAKHHPRVAAYGCVDELSAVLGMALAGGVEEPFRSRLRAIQNDLFDLGADLSCPGDGDDVLRVTAAYTERLETMIDEVNEDLEPLKSFVLAGGTKPAAWMHLARTVCRRAERHLVALAHEETGEGRVAPEPLHYLNRLSDLLFVFARALNDGGRSDVLWEPGAGREG
ncbi:MAG: cob(I)yrinic acid a,c-diamide adenosyltransferase [Planctomycetota bacterium]|jgi:cob(I)alamin adenosyltransferase|nr:cob(I)yrinic acid a,c-diamide adenosyltransferase [Planctomycetota bacterium]MDP6761859.1 cob(I)yrinic acid a,c-diamide adenosyltransferase [Planctomycetota bacterium]MDP6988905.1 cob(I)yrinic acid a,c-diamide adenosyltransferase [Planctomycetota bacterium]